LPARVLPGRYVARSSMHPVPRWHVHTKLFHSHLPVVQRAGHSHNTVRSALLCDVLSGMSCRVIMSDVTVTACEHWCRFFESKVGATMCTPCQRGRAPSVDRTSCDLCLAGQSLRACTAVDCIDAMVCMSFTRGCNGYQLCRPLLCSTRCVAAALSCQASVSMCSPSARRAMAAGIPTPRDCRSVRSALWARTPPIMATRSRRVWHVR
jgi:hypothetical protein